MQKSALYTAALIFTFATVAHAVRIINGFDVTVGTYTVPWWVSIPGVVVAAALALWMVMAARSA
jgi:hypothetical protein